MHNYKYIDGKLMYEEYGNTKLYFTYDAFGNPYSLRILSPSYNDYYYYALNWRGDVVALYDENGVLECRYEYDAWDKSDGPLNSSGVLITSSNHVGNINPLRYRGYYYDSESGFYYLGSRYYDPQTFRFINADGTELLGMSPKSVHNKNLFAYCNDNPINYFDYMGYVTLGVFLSVNCNALLGISLGIGYVKDEYGKIGN